MRLISLGAEYKPLVHDILKTATILMVIEVIQYLRKGDALLDKVFVRQVLYNMAGIVVFYLLIDPVVGSAGEACCSLRKIVGLEPVPEPVEEEKEEPKKE